MKRITASGDAARDAFGRISRGSSILTDRITFGAAAWVRAGRRDDLTGISAVLGCWLRAGMLLGAAYVLYSAARAMPWAMWAATAIWCWKAWRAKPAAEPSEDDGQEQPAQAPAVDLQKTPPPTREQLVQALHAVADPHAHLASLARHLEVDTTAVRKALDGAGIPITGGVREGGRVSTGVKREDLPPPPATPGPRVVAEDSAGQRDNNNSNNVTVERPHEGMVIVRYDNEHAARHHTVRRP